MHYYITCPMCGNNLDPGEKCDCNDERRNKEMLTKGQVDKLNEIRGRLIVRREARKLKEDAKPLTRQKDKIVSK